MQLRRPTSPTICLDVFPWSIPQKTLAQTIREEAQTAASQKLIDSEKCRTFMSRLINATMVATGPSIKGVEVSAWYGLNIYSQAALAGNVRASTSTGIKKDGDVTNYTYGETSNGVITWNKVFYDLDKAGAALQILHESLHLIAGLSDQALANQASIIAKNPKTFAENEEGKIQASRYLNDQIKNHCE
jgi:hypothetical protein